MGDADGAHEVVSLPRRTGLAFSRALRRFWRHGDFFSGAAIGFYALFSLLPLLILLLVILQAIFPAVRIESGISRLFGDSKNADLLIRTVREAYEQRASLGWLGSVTLILAAAGVFGALQTALDRVWESHGRLFPLRVAVGILMMAATLLIFLGILVTIGLVFREIRFSALGALLGWPRAPGRGGGGGHVLALTMTLAQFGIFWVGYRFLPSVPVRWRNAWPGALLAAVSWQLAGYVLGWYLGTVADYTSLYHSLGAVLALLVWVYVLACTFLLGAEFVVQWSLLHPEEAAAREPGYTAARATR